MKEYTKKLPDRMDIELTRSWVIDGLVTYRCFLYKSYGWFFPTRKVIENREIIVPKGDNLVDELQAVEAIVIEVIRNRSDEVKDLLDYGWYEV